MNASCLELGVSVLRNHRLVTLCVCMFRLGWLAKVGARVYVGSDESP
jgi:hypothetical protein